ncbi:MAG: tRNA preQ1(34) S-adenosylmethionine ribosyltransferase-isomerase QueA [bacterium]|nr:tRNA preQ1(34) S-adenosylmethionine ribosyltransferase-isomerase QueA [bacterium]
MKTSDFNYELPPELIAQKPAETRDASRLLLCNRESGAAEHRVFGDIIPILDPGDMLVLNDTKVYPARLLGTREDNGDAEVMLLRALDGGRYRALVRPGKKLQLGDVVTFPDSELRAEIISVLEGGERIVELFGVEDIEAEIDAIGNVPLPPYVQRPDGPLPDDAERYQTVFARHRGAVAAPTAGLHFTVDILEELKKKGIEIRYLTLHVGYGTFAPITVENVADHNVEKEYFSLPHGTARAVNEARVEGRRVIAVGTTAVRALESAATGAGIVKARKETTELFIYPGYQFKVVDALISNFHLPKSSLLALLCALAGYDNVMKWYAAAIAERYRFYSFGDTMFIE